MHVKRRSGCVTAALSWVTIRQTMASKKRKRKEDFFVQAYLILGPYQFTKETNTATREQSRYMEKFDELAEIMYGEDFKPIGQNDCLFSEYYQYFLKEKLKEHRPIRTE